MHDRCSAQAWHCVIEAAALARQRCGKPMALLASLVENMPEDLAWQAAEQGLIRSLVWQKVWPELPSLLIAEHLLKCAGLVCATS